MDCVDILKKTFGLDDQQAVDLMTEVKKERAAVERKFNGQGEINVRTAELYRRLADRTERAALEAAAHKRALIEFFKSADASTAPFTACPRRGCCCGSSPSSRRRGRRRFPPA